MCKCANEEMCKWDGAELWPRWVEGRLGNVQMVDHSSCSDAKRLFFDVIMLDGLKTKR